MQKIDRTAFCAALLLAFGVSGCATEEQQKRKTLDVAIAHCEKEGEQFLFKGQEVEKAGVFTPGSVTTSGECVGPGDPGYVPPASARK